VYLLVEHIPFKGWSGVLEPVFVGILIFDGPLVLVQFLRLYFHAPFPIFFDFKTFFCENSAKMEGLQISSPFIQRIFPAYPRCVPVFQFLLVPVSFQTILYLHNFNFKKYYHEILQKKLHRKRNSG